MVSVKDNILQAGCTLLRERGVGALTQPQIAQAAGVKQSHLTYYFPTRTDLLVAVAEQVVSQTLDRIAASLVLAQAGAPGGPGGPMVPADWAQRMADVLLTGMPPRVIIGLVAAADAEPDIRPALVRLVAHVRQRLTHMLAHLGLAHDPTTALLAHATVLGLAVMYQARLTPQAEQELRTGLLGLIGLLPRHTPTPAPAPLPTVP